MWVAWEAFANATWIVLPEQLFLAQGFDAKLCSGMERRAVACSINGQGRRHGSSGLMGEGDSYVGDAV